MNDPSARWLRCIYSDKPLQGTPIQPGDQISWHYASFKELYTERSTLLESSFDGPALVYTIHKSSNQNYASKYHCQWLLSVGHYLKLGEKSIWRFVDNMEDITFFVHIIGVNDQQISPHSGLSSSLEQFRSKTQVELWKLFTLPNDQEEELRSFEQLDYTTQIFVAYWMTGSVANQFRPVADIQSLYFRRLMQKGFAALALRKIGEECRKFEQMVVNIGAGWIPI